MPPHHVGIFGVALLIHPGIVIDVVGLRVSDMGTPGAIPYGFRSERLVAIASNVGRWLRLSFLTAVVTAKTKWSSQLCLWLVFLPARGAGPCFCF
jgi:hypothetical protein